MSDNRLVVIVEDEPKIAQILVDFLAMDGFRTQVVNDGSEAVQQIELLNPAAVILDVMLPNKDGLTICKEVRAFSNVPIIMLTARVDEIDRLMGLGIGADDYVCKPFSVREVVARIHVILRRTEQAVSQPTESASILRYKQVSIDLERYVCKVSEQAIELTRVEFRLLAAMLKKPGIVFTRDSLMSACYEDDRVVSSRTIDSHMKNLRSKLVQGAKLDASNQVDCDDILHSVYGVGYKIE